jgi:hypothetical protein
VVAAALVAVVVGLAAVVVVEGAAVVLVDGGVVVVDVSDAALAAAAIRASSSPTSVISETGAGASPVVEGTAVRKVSIATDPEVGSPPHISMVDADRIARATTASMRLRVTSRPGVPRTQCAETSD